VIDVFIFILPTYPHAAPVVNGHRQQKSLPNAQAKLRALRIYTM